MCSYAPNRIFHMLKLWNFHEFLLSFLYLKRIGETLKYDVNFRGPLSKRSCTDVCCLFIFIVFCVAWGFIAHYGKCYCIVTLFRSNRKVIFYPLLFLLFFCLHVPRAYAAINNGDLDRLLVPADSKGRKCGVDNSVIDKPFLLFFNLEKCIDPRVTLYGCKTPQVCVEQCPSTSFIYSHYTCNSNTFGQIRSQLICQMDVQMDSIRNCDDIRDRINRQDCASWYLPSNSCKKIRWFQLRCYFLIYFFLCWNYFQ